MKEIKYVLILLFIQCFAKLSAQSISIVNDKCFGGVNSESNASLLLLNDNKICVYGQSKSGVSGNKNFPLCANTEHDVWYLKIDQALNILTQNGLGGSKRELSPYCILFGNSLIFTCSSNSDSSCQRTYPNHYGLSGNSYDYWVCLIDSNDVKLWDRVFGTDEAEESVKLLRTTTNDLMILGVSKGGNNGDKSTAGYGSFDLWLIKTDSVANKIWDNSYGGSDAEYGGGNIANSYLFDMVNTNLDNFVIASSTNSPNNGTITQVSHGFADIYIVKMDSSGSQLWDKRYGGANSEFAEKIITTSDSGFIVLGMTVSAQGGDVTDAPRGDRDIWLLKLDSNGNKVWDKRYGGSQRELANSIVATSDGGYYISGSTLSDSSYEVTEHGYGGYDYWFLKVDSVGNKLWDKRFGGPGDDIASNFIVLADSSIILSGYAESGTSAVKTDLGYGLEDYWLVHFKYEDSVTTNISQLNSNLQFIIHPNPAYTEFTIKLNDLNPVKLVVYDVMGKIILQQQVVSSAAIPVQYLESGIYIVEVHDINGQSSRKKLVKQ